MPIGRFSVGLQPNRLLALLEPLFELPQVHVHCAQVVMKYPLAGIVPATQSIGVNRLVHLARRRVVERRDEVPFILGDTVDQSESLAVVFAAAELAFNLKMPLAAQPNKDPERPIPLLFVGRRSSDPQPFQGVRSSLFPTLTALF